MSEKTCLVLCCLLFLCNACVPIEKVMFRKWNTLSSPDRLKESAKATFKYNVVSSLKKNPELRFFKDIDSTSVMNLKAEFLQRLNKNSIVCQNDSLNSRFEIQVNQFDFEEKRFVETNTLDRLATEREEGPITGTVSYMEIHLLGSIYDRQTNQKKEIKIDDHFKTWLDTDLLTGYSVVERGVNIKPGKRTSNFIIEFVNTCSKFIKEAK